MRRSGTISRATLDAARRALTLLAGRAEGVTKKEAVQELSKEIRAARGNGCGFDQIADALTKSGIAIGRSTLKGYWNQEPGPGSDSSETPVKPRRLESRSARAPRASWPMTEEATGVAQQAAQGRSPDMSPAASDGESAGQKPAEGRSRDMSRPGGGGELAGRLAVEPSADGSTGEVGKSTRAAEAPAAGRSRATSRLAGVGESAGRSAVEGRADAPSADDDGQAAVDLRGSHVVKINTGEI